MSPRELRAIEARRAELHEERMAAPGVVLAPPNEERARCARLQVTNAKPSARVEKQCEECGGRTRAANGTCADCLAARSEALVAAVRSRYYGATVPQVAESLGISFVAAEKRLGRAVRAGVLERVRHGVYAVRRTT